MFLIACAGVYQDGHGSRGARESLVQVWTRDLRATPKLQYACTDSHERQRRAETHLVVAEFRGRCHASSPPDHASWLNQVEIYFSIVSPRATGTSCCARACDERGQDLHQDHRLVAGIEFSHAGIVDAGLN